MRNYSLDLLRIISMVMIVVLHINSHGGLMEYYGIDSVNGILLRFINICCSVAVNVYVLISGYFLIYEKFRVSKIIKLFIEVVAYSWVIAIVLIARGESLTIVDYLELFFPISYNGYWFVTAYIGMYLLSPFINHLLNSLNKRYHLMFVVLIVCMYSLFRDILVKSEPWAVSRGYSLIWFVVLYSVAAYIRKYVDVNKIKHPFLIYGASCIVMLMTWVCMTVLATRFAFIEENGLCSYWLRYNSIFNLIAAVFLFIAFVKKQINGSVVTKIISIVAPLTLGVYLIHDNECLRDIIWIDLLKVNTFENNVMLIPKAMLVVLAVFIICVLIDFIRKTLFDAILYRRQFYKEIIKKIDNLQNKLTNDDKRGEVV